MAAVERDQLLELQVALTAEATRSKEQVLERCAGLDRDLAEVRLEAAKASGRRWTEIITVLSLALTIVSALSFFGLQFIVRQVAKDLGAEKLVAEVENAAKKATSHERIAEAAAAAAQTAVAAVRTQLIRPWQAACLTKWCVFLDSQGHLYGVDLVPGSAAPRWLGFRVSDLKKPNGASLDIPVSLTCDTGSDMCSLIDAAGHVFVFNGRSGESKNYRALVKAPS